MSIPRQIARSLAAAVLWVGGAAFAVGCSHQSDSPSKPAPPQAVATCWDGSGVDRGERCSTAYDARALFWAFGIDPHEATCERSSSYDWSSLGLKCEYKGTDLRMAVWNSTKWRDRRLLDYGKPTAIGRGLILQAPGDAGRYVLRYGSQRVLIYASVKDDDVGLLKKLRPHVRSLKEVEYGVKSPK